MFRTVSAISLLLLSTLLVACGFHLRGMDQASFRQLPFTSVYIDSTLPVANEVGAILRNYPQLTVLKSAAKAQAVLRFGGEKQTKDIMTIDRSGQVQEYQLNYSVPVQLYMYGQPVGREMVLRQSRNLTYSDSAILGKNQEEDMLWVEMRRNAASLLPYRLSSNNMLREIASAAAANVPPTSSAPLAKAP